MLFLTSKTIVREWNWRKSVNWSIGLFNLNRHHNTGSENRASTTQNLSVNGEGLELTIQRHVLSVTLLGSRRVENGVWCPSRHCDQARFHLTPWLRCDCDDIFTLLVWNVTLLGVTDVTRLMPFDGVLPSHPNLMRLKKERNKGLNFFALSSSYTQKRQQKVSCAFLLSLIIFVNILVPLINMIINQSYNMTVKEEITLM